MNNDENKDFKLNETGLINGKRKVVLGQDELLVRTKLTEPQIQGSPLENQLAASLGNS